MAKTNSCQFASYFGIGHRRWRSTRSSQEQYVAKGLLLILGSYTCKRCISINVKHSIERRAPKLYASARTWRLESPHWHSKRAKLGKNREFVREISEKHLQFLIVGKSTVEWKWHRANSSSTISTKLGLIAAHAYSNWSKHKVWHCFRPAAR